MDTGLEIFAWTIVATLALPVMVFAVECLWGVAANSARQPQALAPAFAVLMPAHDEAAGIGATILAVQAQLRASDRLLVVADNCSDETAVIARALGAQVVERTSTTDRGKGFALAAGRAALMIAPPSVVVVLDADCRPESGALQRLVAEAVHYDAAVQGCYLLAAEPSASTSSTDAATQLSCFAFAVKNLVRQRGLQRLGIPALLQGSGMAFPWPMFAAARLSSANIVEDLELGLDLVLAGRPVRFLAAAGFTSAASTRDATIAQRTRWEHGSMGTAWRFAPTLLAAGLRGGRPALGLLALDLLIPPLALLTLLQVVALAVQAGLTLFAGESAPLLAQTGIMAVFAAAVALAWHFAGRAILLPGTLLQIPSYVVWKLPIYWRLLVDRERNWIRTRRDA